EGSCTALPAAMVPSPECGGYLCDGTHVGCPPTCTSDAGCRQGFNCGVLGSCQAKLETLVDDFNDHIIDSTLWRPDAYPGSSVVETKNREQITVSPWVLAFAGYYSVNAYDPRSSHATIALLNAGTAGTVSTSSQTAKFKLTDVTGNEAIAFQVGSGQLQAMQVAGGTWTPLQTVAYDAGTHRYLQFRFDEAGGGTAYWETSADRTTFSVLTSAPMSPWMQSTFVQFYAGNDDAGDDAGETALFDDLNVMPPAAPVAGADGGADPNGFPCAGAGTCAS